MPLNHPPRRRTGLLPGNNSERIVVPALAEDSPHSPALQVGRTAPCPQYKPSRRSRLPNPRQQLRTKAGPSVLHLKHAQGRHMVR
jgi:hypothetical protein